MYLHFSGEEIIKAHVLEECDPLSAEVSICLLYTSIPNKNARRAAPALFNGIPGVYVLECGDRIVEGVGDEITTREQWGSFVPANRPGVVTVDWVRDMGCRNVLYHVEAGGKQ